MPKVNYIRECRAFTAAAAERGLGANEIALWHALFEAFNRKASGEDWPDGYLSISNARLLALTPFGAGDSGCDILRRARERLARQGFIRYRAGERRRLAPAYQMVWLHAEEAGEGAPGGRIAANPGGKTGGNQETSALGRAAARIPNPKGNLCHTPSIPGDPGHDCAGGPAFDGAWRISARARGAVAQRLIDAYPGRIDSVDAWGGLCEVMAQGLSPERILAEMPGRPVFSRLIARLRALALAQSSPPRPARDAPPPPGG